MYKPVLLLLFSNMFMTFAWYGHLKHMAHRPLAFVILFSWCIALFESILMIPANRIGINYYTLGQLRVMQEVISLTVR